MAHYVPSSHYYNVDGTTNTKYYTNKTDLALNCFTENLEELDGLNYLIQVV